MAAMAVAPVAPKREGGMVGWFVGGHHGSSSEGKHETVELFVLHCGSPLWQ